MHLKENLFGIDEGNAHDLLAVFYLSRLTNPLVIWKTIHSGIPGKLVHNLIMGNVPYC